MSTHASMGGPNPFPEGMPIADLKRQAHLAYIVASYGVELKRDGHEMKGCCPFHEDDSPSFTVYRDDSGNERWKCFGCTLGGDVLDFIQRKENLTLPMAKVRLLELTGLHLEDAPRPAKQAAAAKKKKPAKKPGRELEHYDYVDADGQLLSRVVRHEAVDDSGTVILRDNGQPDKVFTQRRPDGKGGWIKNLTGVERVLYRLPAVLTAETIWLAEGEKDVHSLEALGLTATTAPQGASSPWLDIYSEQLRGRDVVIVPDTDTVGQERGAKVANALYGVAESVRIVNLPLRVAGLKDVTDYIISAGIASADELLALAVPFVPKPPEAPTPSGKEHSHRSVDSGGAENWRTALEVNKEHNPKALLRNAILALECCPVWRGHLRYNEFSMDITVEAGVHLPWLERPLKRRFTWDDQADRCFTNWLQANGIQVQISIAAAAVQTVARNLAYHPVREYLADLKWDGGRRLDTWLQRYVGAANSEFISAIGTCWAISAVARVMEPGCQADHVLVLEGAQGLKKSTALRTLAGDDFFTDEIAELGTKDSAIQCAGVWIIELAELESLGRGEQSKVKAFVTRRIDRYRPPYGRIAIKAPRQCVFAATVNPNASGSYACFKDETGARRWWPVRCTKIDIDGLKIDRDQIWAEAVHRYHAGEKWWLDGELIQSAEIEQRARLESDPWFDSVVEWLENPEQRSERDGQFTTMVEPYNSTAEGVTISDILVHGIGKISAQCTQTDSNRVARILTVLGWERRLKRLSKTERIWKYVKVEPK